MMTEFSADELTREFEAMLAKRRDDIASSSQKFPVVRTAPHAAGKPLEDQE